MHSPEVLAHSIHNPIPKRMQRIQPHQYPKFELPLRRRSDGSWYTAPFMRAFGYEWYFESIIDIWHMEPHGKDSLTVCRDRIVDADGKFVRWSHAWKWHINHWKVSPTIVYKWRRKLLTRCNECGGRSKKGNVVNHSTGNRVETPWWCAEYGLYHSECASKVIDRGHHHDPQTCWKCTHKSE